MAKQKQVSSEVVVPKFPIEAFPPAFRGIIKNLEKEAKFNADHVCTTILTTASALIGNSVKIQIKNTWKEPLIMWSAIVADSGSMKSPIINFCTNPLLKQETLLAELHIDKVKEWEDKREDFYSSKSNKGMQFNIEKPRRPDMIVSTATIEGVRDAFKRNDRGFILLQDELAGWIKDMTAYSSGSAQEQWLSLFNGKFVKANTKGEDATFITNPFVSVCGGIQPAKLYLMAKDGRDSDGSLYRVLFSYPDAEPVHALDDSDIETETIDTYEGLMMKLYKIGNKEQIKNDLFTQPTFEDPFAPPPTEPTPKKQGAIPDKKGNYLIGLSTEAKSLFYAWNAEISGEINSDLENSMYRSVMKKLEGYVPRIAGILECLYWSDSEKDYFPSEVSKAAMQGAIKIIDYYKSTALKVQGVLNRNTKDDASASASRYKVRWNEVFVNEKSEPVKEMKKGDLIDKLLLFGMSHKTAQRKIEAELTQVKHGIWTI